MILFKLKYYFKQHRSHRWLAYSPRAG